jgi:glucokinase
MAHECGGVMSASDSFRAIAFTAPAPVAKDFDGVLTKLPNLPSLVGMNLKTDLQHLFQLPVLVENDATAAGIGEAWMGASKGVENSICVTLGTGIGGGIIINNEPLRGKDGIGGEIGHICVEPDGHPCGCGSHGCIEQYASATAIVRMAGEAGLDIATSEDVYDLYKDGNEIAEGVFRAMGRYLGITLAGLANALNPEMIVICGGVTAGWDAFACHVEDEIKIRAYPAAAARAPLTCGKLGDNAGLLGAARSAFIAAV